MRALALLFLLFATIAPTMAPAEEAGAVPVEEAGPVLAATEHGTLSAADAAAFHEALLFSLGYVGRERVAARLSQQAVAEALTRAYPTLGVEDQKALANSRAIWRQVQADWPSEPASHRYRFVASVIDFAMGARTTASHAPAPDADWGNSDYAVVRMEFAR